MVWRIPLATPSRTVRGKRPDMRQEGPLWQLFSPAWVGQRSSDYQKALPVFWEEPLLDWVWVPRSLVYMAS